MSLYSYTLGTIGIFAMIMCGGALDSDKPVVAVLLLIIFTGCFSIAIKDERR